MTYEPDLSQDSGGLQALVIQPDPDCPIDRIGPWLHNEGITTRTIQPFRGELIPEVFQEDALVVLGGNMSSLDDHAYSWLSDIRRILADAASRAKPTLGICLGAQLMAQAFGGTVTKGDQGLEAGVAEVSLRAEAAEDQLMAGLPDPCGSHAQGHDQPDSAFGRLARNDSAVSAPGLPSIGTSHCWSSMKPLLRLFGLGKRSAAPMPR